MNSLKPLLIIIVVAVALLFGAGGFSYVYAEYIAPLEVQKAYEEIPESVRQDPDAALTFNAQEGVVEVAEKGFDTVAEVVQSGNRTLTTVVVSSNVRDIVLVVGVVFGIFMLMGGLKKPNGSSA